MRKISHIINPFTVGPSSSHFVAQQITFETMKIAKEFAHGQVDVMLYYTKFYDESTCIPDGFVKTPDLTRSILDIATFKEKRKLPLIKDILDRLYENTDAEYLIYTNVDIALMPHFYVSVNQLIEQGDDAFTINRRTIPEIFNRLQDIPLMYSQIGKVHSGSDCFVFKRNCYPDFFLGTACIGTGRIGKILLANVVCHAKKSKNFKDLHLTFHIGEDMIWKNDSFADYIHHNENELYKVLSHYKDQQVLLAKHHGMFKDYFYGGPKGYKSFVKKMFTKLWNNK